MRLTHLGHSTVLVEGPSARVLIDPGNYSTAWHELSGLDLIAVTHSHPDHIDPEWLPALLRRNPTARLLVEPQVATVVDLPEGAEPFPAGSSTVVGSLRIEAVGGRHALIHRDIPRIGNVGLVICEHGGPRFFHPGDSLETVPPDVAVAAVPAHAPWCAMKEIIDFTRAVGAGRGFLIHEGLVNQRGWATTFNRLNEMTGTVMTDLRGGGSLTV